MGVASEIARFWNNAGRPQWIKVGTGGGPYGVFSGIGAGLALLREMPPPLFSFGVSASAVSEALLASRLPEECWSFELEERDFIQIDRWALLRAALGGFKGWTGLLKAMPVVETIKRRVLKGDLFWPLHVTHVDLVSGLPVTKLITKADEMAAWSIYESMCIPLLYQSPALRVDGGLLNNVPIDEAVDQLPDYPLLNEDPPPLVVVTTTLGVETETYSGRSPFDRNTPAWVLERMLASIEASMKAENMEAGGLDVLVARVRPEKAGFTEVERFGDVRRDAWDQMVGAAAGGELLHVRDGWITRIAS